MIGIPNRKCNKSKKVRHVGDSMPYQIFYVFDSRKLKLFRDCFPFNTGCCKYCDGIDAELHVGISWRT